LGSVLQRLAPKKIIRMECVDNKIYESKRANTIVYTGNIKGLINSKSVYIISSLVGEIGDTSISISINTNWCIVPKGKVESIMHLTASESF